VISAIEAAESVPSFSIFAATRYGSTKIRKRQGPTGRPCCIDLTPSKANVRMTAIRRPYDRAHGRPGGVLLQKFNTKFLKLTLGAAFFAASVAPTDAVVMPHDPRLLHTDETTGVLSYALEHTDADGNLHWYTYRAKPLSHVMSLNQHPLVADVSCSDEHSITLHLTDVRAAELWTSGTVLTGSCNCSRWQVVVCVMRAAHENRQPRRWFAV